MNNKFIKYIGYIITIAAFIFIGKSLISMDLDVRYITNPLSAVIFIILMSIGYAIMVYVSSYAWKSILEFINKDKIPFNEITGVYVKSNIAKYLPGNFMHFAGRNLLAGKLGFKQLDITFCSILEILMLVFTSLILSCIFAMRSLKSSIEYVLTKVNISIVVAVILAVILVIAISIWFICKRTKFLKNYSHLFTKGFLKLLVKLFFIYGLTLVVPGVFLLLCLKLILSAQVSAGAITIIIFSYILSWVLGFIVPGAPGGVGIREALLIFILTPFYTNSIVLLAAVLLRIISTLGDLIAFITEPVIIKYYNRGRK
ncbi:hypothetical protein CPAST_c03380 [Clostridium pasteurianum DSM 525 = ATCC 6013]|uniref:Phosphatidylglycerol lysyltransferase n=1 Tax=Clostridium pasteurianum DSM 525 = ATCC 6013 TaxID=1262449 RepID=A0A0H3J3F6_CLOPA|nr:lysylphosphatidylglycerol synthase domain-containing protein [Clostridium pasteurianum]AJA46438.1 hypothetical protein CPAST_c03380 [Clostridium pasteurianum DSM 525 = ATCC 6013]AJA50426.1 hypothetical protein CLPA_c03380 [Clostridium pasteurianum DSM 525 = ATCC 6013]AOZ73872.1 CAAX protease [Clostridium pasteurianum DSM 525 = ATCC 6013]AOZ77669.1 CAAX protease [Clostridium pasteurianum]ELP61013.1 hypothetical protein F502_01110 [Clostridium pasteurianum DSM 525 = ATCC 6013]